MGWVCYNIYIITEKANGENFQVSFNPVFNCWIIGSKTVTIACRDEKDIEFFNSTFNVYLFC